MFAAEEGDKGKQGPKGMDGIIGFKGKKVFACSAEIIITELTTKNCN